MGLHSNLAKELLKTNLGKVSIELEFEAIIKHFKCKTFSKPGIVRFILEEIRP